MVSFDIPNQEEIKRLRRSDLIELIDKMILSNQSLAELLSVERKKNWAYQNIIENNDIQKFLESFFSSIAIKNTSSIRIIGIEKDFYFQPFALGRGKNESEYSYLDTQINDLLGGKNFLVIPDTSKSHQLKFSPDKEYPRTILAYPIILNEEKVGFVWVGDETYQAYTNDEQQKISALFSEYQTALSVLFELNSIKQEVNTYHNVLNILNEPVLVLNLNSDIIYANTAALEVFDLNLGEDYFLHGKDNQIKNFIQKNQKVTEAIFTYDKWEYSVSIARIRGNESGSEAVYIFKNKTKERARDKYLSLIVSTISRSLQSPIIDIKGLASVVSSLGNLSEKQNEYLKKIILNSQRLEQTLEDMLSINRIQEESFVKLEEIDIGENIKKVINILKPLLMQKQITVNNDLEPGSMTLISDKTFFHQALLNILDRAIHETNLGGGIEITTQSNTNYFSLCIKDSGKGISKLDIQKALDTRDFGIIGDELMLASKIIWLLNGDILADSSLGSGTTITLKFPLIEE